jgi:hypothetical protein
LPPSNNVRNLGDTPNARPSFFKRNKKNLIGAGGGVGLVGLGVGSGFVAKDLGSEDSKLANAYNDAAEWTSGAYEDTVEWGEEAVETVKGWGQ